MKFCLWWNWKNGQNRYCITIIKKVVELELAIITVHWRRKLEFRVGLVHNIINLLLIGYRSLFYFIFIIKLLGSIRCYQLFYHTIMDVHSHLAPLGVNIFHHTTSSITPSTSRMSLKLTQLTTSRTSLKLPQPMTIAIWLHGKATGNFMLLTGSAITF